MSINQGAKHQRVGSITTAQYLQFAKPTIISVISVFAGYRVISTYGMLLYKYLALVFSVSYIDVKKFVN